MCGYFVVDIIVGATLSMAPGNCTRPANLQRIVLILALLI